ncbi:MAG: hypothetical protein ABSH03_07625 [Candidatus Lustribacter sp.]
MNLEAVSFRIRSECKPADRRFHHFGDFDAAFGEAGARRQWRPVRSEVLLIPRIALDIRFVVEFQVGLKIHHPRTRKQSRSNDGRLATQMFLLCPIEAVA